MGYNINPAFVDDDNKLSTTNATIELGNKSTATSIPNGLPNEAVIVNVQFELIPFNYGQFHFT